MRRGIIIVVVVSSQAVIQSVNHYWPTPPTRRQLMGYEVECEAEILYFEIIQMLCLKRVTKSYNIHCNIIDIQQIN